MDNIKNDLLVKVALKNGLVAEEHLNATMRELGALHKAGQTTRTLGDLLTEKGLINFDEARALLQRNSVRTKISGRLDPLGMKIEQEYEENQSEDLPDDTPEDDDPGSTQRREKQARFEDYRIIRRLGADAAGTTYQAVYIPDHSRVILRILSLQSILDDPKATDNFLAVLKQAYKLDHPGIQKILRGARKNRRLFYAAEYLTGNSLRKVLMEKNTLGIGDTLDIAIQVTRALEHAHNKKICHTQLDPSKLILDVDGRVRLVGFGLGGDVARNLQWLAESLGDMPYYVAPELVTGVAGENLIGPTTDIYSLGAIVYHCLTGVPPFKGNSLDEVLLDMYQSENLYERLNQVPGITPELSALVLEMIFPEPKKRVKSTTELLNRLLKIEEQVNPSASARREAKGKHGPAGKKGAPGAGAKQPANEPGKGRLGRVLQNRMLRRKIDQQVGRSSLGKTAAMVIAILIGVGGLVYLVVHGLSTRGDMQANMIKERLERQQQEHLEKVQKALKENAVKKSEAAPAGAGKATE